MMAIGAFGQYAMLQFSAENTFPLLGSTVLVFI